MKLPRPCAESGRRRAVTLMELLCVVAIIAILAAIYLTAVSGAFKRALKFLGLFGD